MVFAGMMNEDGHHSIERNTSIEGSNDHDHMKSEYHCCENSDSSIAMRNLVSPSNEVPVTSHTSHVFLSPLSVEDLPQPSFLNYRPNAPPDPWAYSSLVGSIKRLD